MTVLVLLRPLVALAAALTLGLVAGALADTAEGRAPMQDPVPVGGRIHAENACYVRLPDIPRGLYGGFGGYNAETSVLFYVGGAEKRTEENTIVYFDLYGMQLTSPQAAWRTIPYGSNVGYTRAADRGCREMANVQVSTTNWLSVWGKDGCKGGGSSDGDIKEIRVGDSATAQGISWVPNTGASEPLPTDLQDGKGKLIRPFAAWDSKRNRLVYGQGSFDDAVDSASQDKVYVATAQGSKWRSRQILPTGTAPYKRFGTCAAYVNDEALGLDGVFILGGMQGGANGSPYAEAWWLDFARRESGEWVDITSRFDNWDRFGFRREGACAYDPTTQSFYSWMGRASSSIPEGASRSAGMWRANLTALADSTGTLSWERLAPDKLPGINGRRLIPSIWDPVQRRVLVIGGRNNLDEYSDVWAIYPDVTGGECDAVDPFAVVPTPTPTAPPPTNTPGAGTPVPVPPTATPPLQPGQGQVCDFLVGRVPNAVINHAVSAPDTTYGWSHLCFPNRPVGPFNGFREHLSLRNIAQPYHPIYNTVVWKCGCP